MPKIRNILNFSYAYFSQKITVFLIEILPDGTRLRRSHIVADHEIKDLTAVNNWSSSLYTLVAAYYLLHIREHTFTYHITITFSTYWF